jgi:hypothetical protein
VLTVAQKTRRMALALTFFLEWYQKDGDEFLQHRKSYRWWNLGFICECWTQRTIKAVDAHIHQTSRKGLNKRLPERWWQTAFWDRKGVLMVWFMLEGTTVKSEM